MRQSEGLALWNNGLWAGYHATLHPDMRTNYYAVCIVYLETLTGIPVSCLVTDVMTLTLVHGTAQKMP